MPGELLSVLVSISRGHNEIQTIEKTFKVKHRVLKLRFADIANHKREILLFWKDCFLFGGVFILSVKLIMHWETRFNQAMHE